LAKCKFMVSQDLTYTYKRRLYILIRADSYCREFPLPLYCCGIVYVLIAIDDEYVWVFISIKDKDNTW